MIKLFKKLKRLSLHISIRFYNEHTVANYYRKTVGIVIGENCRIMDRRIGLFGGEPYLIEIGNNVTIAEDVKFITHDGGVGVLRKKHPGVNVFGKIKVHDNCFIGVNSVIMPNVTIGANSVIGAGSIVTRDVDPDSVFAGVPAKKICSISDYEKKVLTRCVYIESNAVYLKKEIIHKYFKGLNGW